MLTTFFRSTLIIMAVAFLASGCATMERGTHQDVTILSEPLGAWVETANCGLQKQPALMTPATIAVSRRASHCTIYVWKEGYDTVSARLQRRFEPAGDVVVYAELVPPDDLFSSFMFLSVLMLGGLAVDSATGAAFVIEPDQIVIQLAPSDDREWSDDEQ
jgi:hypothetical protein